MKFNNLKNNRILSAFLIVQIILVQLLNNFPNYIEKYYSNGIYKFISSNFRFIFGWLPFSVGDLIYIFLIVFVFRFLIKLIKERQQNLEDVLYQIGANFSIIYFLFYILWGLNYSRVPLTDSMQLKPKEYNLKELSLFSEKLLTKVNNLQLKITKDDTIAVVVPFNNKKIIEQTANGYNNLSSKFLQFSYKHTSLKKSLFSIPLTYMGFAGYFNPFSGEAQVDYLIPKVTLPITCSHEVAHQLGIASESEANFIGFLAAINNENIYFQYAAYFMAYRYTLYDIYKKDKNIYKSLIDKTPLGIKKNLKEIDNFWSQYQNPAEPIFKYLYDNYLKVNQQKDGIESYNKMVGLLLAYDEKYPL